MPKRYHIFTKEENYAMRCGCPECGSYMVHAEGLRTGCVCASCGYRCGACLGTNTVISREEIKSLKEKASSEKKNISADRAE